jgi:hypothetical protein
LWLTEVAVIGAGMSLVDSFLFVFLQDDFQSTTKFCGYTVGVTVVFEIPIFHYSNYLLKEWGHDVLFVIAMVAYVIRAFDYKLLTTSTVQWSWHSKLCMVSRLHACGLHRSIFRQG